MCFELFVRKKGFTPTSQAFLERKGARDLDVSTHATSGEGSAATRATQHKKWFEEIAHVFNRHAIILSA